MKLMFCALVLLVSMTAAADDKKISSVVNLYGVTFQYGAPPWVVGAPNPLSAVNPYRNQQGNNFVLEFIPADEEFDSWKTMFAVSAMRNNRTIPVDPWIDYSLATLKRVCKGYRDKVLHRTDKVALVQMSCPRVVGAPMKGYEGGMGEIGIFAFLVQGEVLINHHIEWRGKAFDPDDEATWPVAQDQIDIAIGIMREAKAIKEDSVVGFGQP